LTIHQLLRIFPEQQACIRCNNDSHGTSAVDAHPNGKTPEGLWDLCGNAWEMTESERSAVLQPAFHLEPNLMVENCV